VLGDALVANNREVEAIPPYEIYLRYANNPDPVVHAKLGRAYRANGDFAAAMQAFDTALTLVPDSFAVLLDRGLLYVETGDPNRGLEDIQAALRLNPDSFEANAAVGQAYFRLGDFQKAVDELNKLADKAQDDSQRALLFYWRAQALEPLDVAAAAADWQQFLSLPESAAPAAWFEMGRQKLALPAADTPTPSPTGFPGTPTP
jgi:tetratricopeptide (TPR) repeat protein